MKIVICSDGFPIEGYPVYVFVEQLVVALVKRGHEITVIAPQSIVKCIFRGIPVFPRRETRVVGNGLEYKIFRPIVVTFGKNRYLKFIANWYKRFRIEAILSKMDKIDVLYGHFWHNALIMKEFALRNNIPLFVACGEGDSALEDMRSKMTDDEVDKLRSLIAGIISVSSENKRKCESYGLARQDNIEVFPNSVDKSQFKVIDKERCRKLLNISKDDFVLIYVGAFIHRKGSRRVAEAIKKLNIDRIKIFFIGAPMGSDDCTPDCKGIIHLGKIKHEELPIYLNASDAFILPTLNEGCCNAIVEAASCGLPVISSDRPFNDDILDSTNSIRVDPTNIDQISQAIYELLNNIDLRQKLSRGAVEKTDELTIENRAGKIEEFILKHI